MNWRFTMHRKSSRLTALCVHCGQSFSRFPSAMGPYCSHSCEYAARRRIPTDRFWTRVDKSSDCWNYQDGSRRYGRVTLENGRRIYAHRFSWELHFGPVSSGMYVCHHCDNPRCVRPDHLFLGTMADNQRDMVLKGRSTTRLTASQVRDIRTRYGAGGITQQTLASEFGCHQRTISRIVLKQRKSGHQHVA